MRIVAFARIAALACGFVNCASAFAQKAPPVTIMVGFAPGGLFDLTARLWSHHLGRFLPGDPAIVVQNVPGAGSMVAANNLYNLAPHDGTTLAIIDGATVLRALVGDPSAKYDPRQFSWIGGRSQETPICGVWHDAKAKTFEDLRTIETTVGSSGPSHTTVHPLLFNALLGTKFRIIAGYSGGPAITQAMERGEVDGYCGWSWGTIKSLNQQWLRDGQIRLLLQAGIEKNPELPDVPFALDLAPSKAAHDIMETVLTDGLLSWPLVAPPGLPPGKMGQLRAAFEAMMKDPELLEEARKEQLDIDLIPGTEMEDAVDRLFALPPAVIAQTKAILN